MSRGKQISLSLASTYARGWGIWEGIRELVQNWHDGVYENLDILIQSGTLPIGSKVDFVQTDDRGNSFHALCKGNNAGDTNHDVLLGSLQFNSIDQKLFLINKNTSLHKKILLLGYSKKAMTKEVIGQFGEGLKIGALALVREGRVVTMETSCDRWRFDLADDEEFGEKVLTVFVSDRPNDSVDSVTDDNSVYFPECNIPLAVSDTCTGVTLEASEWHRLQKNFLFLVPPKDSVTTEAGTLLLDDYHSGQLYVKGVWVSNLRGEELSAGVNLLKLQLDRDRNAVPRPSEIDQLVSCMWVKALENHPELAAKYYKLLKHNKNRDVKHAIEYCSASVASLVAHQFSLDFGENIFPVHCNATQHELDVIKLELSKKVVLCNETLLSLLHLSGQYISLDVAIATKEASAREVRPLASLSAEERAVLDHAVMLTNLADPSISTAAVDVLLTKPSSRKLYDFETCVMRGSRFLVPDWMFNLEIVHTFGRLCSDDSDKCLCRETRLCHNMLQVPRPTTSGFVQSQQVPGYHHELLRVLAPLALQACNAASKVGFCLPLHQKVLDDDPAAVHKECMDREQLLQDSIKDLTRKMEDQLCLQKEQFDALTAKLTSVEKELGKKEVQLMNEEQNIRDQYEIFLRQKDGEMQRLKQETSKTISAIMCENKDLCDTIKHQRETIDKLVGEREQCENVVSRKEENMLDELLHYVEQCKQRGESMKKLCQEKLKEEKDTSVKEKYNLIINLLENVAEQLQKEYFLCVVCMRKRRSHIVVPCGHYQMCGECADQIHTTNGKCPTCKEYINECLKVFQ